jgi:hypothetical protein
VRQVQTHGLKAKVKDIGEAARVGRGNPSKIFNKQLLDEVFVISRIMKVEISVISQAEDETDNTSRRDLITLIIRESTKTTVNK